MYSCASDRITGRYEKIAMKMDQVSHKIFDQKSDNHVKKAILRFMTSAICRNPSEKEKKCFPRASLTGNDFLLSLWNSKDFTCLS